MLLRCADVAQAQEIPQRIRTEPEDYRLRGTPSCGSRAAVVSPPRGHTM